MSRAPKSPPASRDPPPPLDAAALERLALRYVERFATTRGLLAAYLDRKLRERGWSGEGAADAAGLAERMASLGYVDDLAFAEARAAAMARRGLGARRVAEALRHARIGEIDAQAVAPDIATRAVEAALAFARRRRIGPFGREETPPADRAAREKQLGQMIRAGHAHRLARRIVDMMPGDAADPADFV